MPTKSWRKNTSITQKLLESPYEFRLQQAIRLLERSAHFKNKQTAQEFAKNPIARFTPPSTESIRLSANTSLAFPSAEVSGITRLDKNDSNSQWKVRVNVMGITGSMGVLPYHYTELALKRTKQKDETMIKFFDLFNHRTISLAYQAASKYRLPLQYERNKLHTSRINNHAQHTQALLSLIGMGTAGLNNRLHTKDESLLYYCGLFSQKIRTASGLKQILSSHFDIPVGINQFVGQWQDLIDDVRSKLPEQMEPLGRNVCLGRTAMLGKRGWFAQGKIRIILGPLNKQQLQQFSPGRNSLKALHEITQLYVGMENDYEFIIRVKKSDFPEQLTLSKGKSSIVGWNTRLPSKSTLSTINDTLDISVSSKQLA
jgi:type VI secretion system protein ImpH